MTLDHVNGIESWLDTPGQQVRVLWVIHISWLLTTTIYTSERTLDITMRDAATRILFLVLRHGLIQNDPSSIEFMKCTNHHDGYKEPCVI